MVITESGHEIIEIPYGKPDTTMIYINDVEYDNITDFKIYKEINKVWYFSGIVYDTVSGDANVAKDKIIKVAVGNTVVFVGVLNRPVFGTYETAEISGTAVVANELKKYVVQQNVVDESKFDVKTLEYIIQHICSKNNDGIAPWIVTPTITDNISGMTVRGDNDHKLNVALNTVDAADYEWNESWGILADNYDLKKFNVAETIGSAVSKYEFLVTGNNQNSIVSNREEDVDDFATDIIVLGSGDGINQIKSRTYHATTNRTYLTAALTKTGTTVNVTSTTGFPGTGNIWIGTEKVSYTGTTATSFTGCGRGAAFMTYTNTFEEYAHSEGIEVWDAQYTTSSAQAGSEIDNIYHKQKRLENTKVISQDALDKIAQGELNRRKVAVVRQSVEPIDIFDVLDINGVDVGDTVTITDVNAGNSGTTRIVALEININFGYGTLMIFCNNKFNNTTDVINETTEQTKGLSYYMQGGPSVISIQSYENAQQSTIPEDKAMKMKFRIWNKTQAITDARLDFKILPFRAYANSSQTASSGGSSTPSSSSSDTAEYVNEAFTIFNKGDKVDTSVSNEYVITRIPSAASGTFDGCVVTIQLINFSGSSDDYYYEILNITKSTTLQASTKKTLAYGEGFTRNLSFTSSEVSDSDNLKLNITDGIVGTDISSIREGSFSIRIQAKTTHTHTVSIPAHTHLITMAHGIFEKTIPDTPTVKVAIGEDTSDSTFNTNKTYLTDSANSTISDPTYGTVGIYNYSTHDDVDIATELRNIMGDLSSTKRIRIQFEPQDTDKTCRIEANADLFVFLGSV